MDNSKSHGEMGEVPESIRPILLELKANLAKIYGKRLKNVILYGSYARGDFTQGSDIDIMIILDAVKDPLKERKKYFGDIYKLDVRYNTVISVISFSEKDFKTRKLPLILNAKREGVAV